MKIAFVHHCCAAAVLMNVECSGQSGQTFGISQQDFRNSCYVKKKIKIKPVTRVKQQVCGNLYKGQEETGLHCASRHEQLRLSYPLQPLSYLLNM